MIKSFLILLRNASPGPLTWFSIWSKFKEESHCCAGETVTSKLGHLCSERCCSCFDFFFLQWPKKKENKPNIKIDRVSPYCCQQKCSVTCFLQCCLSGHFYWLGLKKCLEYFSCSHNLEELCCRMNREVSGQCGVKYTLQKDQSATTLKPLAGEVNNIDYLVTLSKGVRN